LPDLEVEVEVVEVARSAAREEGAGSTAGEEEMAGSAVREERAGSAAGEEEGTGSRRTPPDHARLHRRRSRLVLARAPPLHLDPSCRSDLAPSPLLVHLRSPSRRGRSAAAPRRGRGIAVAWGGRSATVPWEREERHTEAGVRERGSRGWVVRKRREWVQVAQTLAFAYI
jgi:hypothetical protein